MTIPPIAYIAGILAGLGLIGLAVPGLIAGGQTGSTFVAVATGCLGGWLACKASSGLKIAVQRPRYRKGGWGQR